MVEFKNTMRYQLATFKEPNEGVPNDPKETQRQRTQSTDPKQRDRTKSKEKAPRKKTVSGGGGYTLQVQKSIDTPSAPPSKIESKKATPATKIKRKAPTPPKVAASPRQSAIVQKTPNDNPFLDDDDEVENTGNPFLDENDIQESDSNNPFLDEKGTESESNNPFLDDEDEEEEKGTNPFLD